MEWFDKISTRVLIGFASTLAIIMAMGHVLVELGLIRFEVAALVTYICCFVMVIEALLSGISSIKTLDSEHHHF